ncbi:MAG TPA: RagB/SusD family nutrient uptake outer membrane protein [Candidatus Bacteroides merdipullorum]|uniref:RagB/SusD family nutrient uptake outer membrane protein n=1 Tax=Candidatus Bacteroides merdipullorum TaxID=2838474 RepID=A0A9D2A5H8_9BACE|nr:RagB/SusD family nutrient uptake outer membrane protein [Candidatus Bacteroides merdipullorum]
MKKIFNYMFAALVGCATLTSCLDDALETAPTDSMSGDALLGSASTALIPLNGIYRSMYSSWSPAANTHQSFGISSYNLMADVMGEDMIQAAQGSGWFWFDCLYQVKSRFESTAWRSYDVWNCYYTWISNANYIIDREETMTGDADDVAYIIGQAYAIRAYSYFMLAQTFARTYDGHEDEPCCPIYTEPTQAGTQGNPRSTVRQVYEQIVSDMDEHALPLLEGKARQHITHISYAVACGLRARIALVMNDWTTARQAAINAINAARQEGRGILPVASFRGLNDASAANVMWGATIISDQSTIYASFFSHMDACDELGASAGAYGASARKQISRDLYSLMSSTDTRRDWWDPNNEENGEDGGYQQEKFKFSNRQTWTGDYIWMRVEEMYLTLAEAECRLDNDADAINYLTQLMGTRVEGYTCTKSGTSLGTTSSQRTGSLLEEIIDQRRIELWGEFGRIYDLRRLHQGFRRTAAMGWPRAALLDGRPSDDPESYMWVLTIPQTEFDGNVNMNPATDQNPVGDLAD